MNCQDIRKLLDEGVVGRLEVAERARVDLHLRSCWDCAQEWDAHERMLAAAIPAVPRDLTERCRALAATAIPIKKRRHAGLRPAVLGAVILLGAAAAAMLTLEWSVESPRAGDAATPAAMQIESAGGAGAGTASTAAQGRARAQLVETVAPVAAASSQASSTPRGSAVSGFTVAVPPLVHATTSADARAVAESIYAALLEQLRAVPSLELIVLDEPVPEQMLVAAVKAPDPARIAENQIVGRSVSIFRAFSPVDDPGPSVTIARSGPAGGALTATEDVIFGAGGTLPPDESGGNAPVLFNLALSAAAPASPAGGGGPGAGAFVVRSDIEGAEPATLGSIAPAVFPAYDYLLNASSHAEVDPATNLTETFGFRIKASKFGSPGITALEFGGRLFDRIDPEEYAHEAVDQLRKTLFDPDASLLEELAMVVLDQGATRTDRIGALRDLAAIANRTGMDGRSTPIVAAAIDLASTAVSPEERAQIWGLIRGVGDGSIVRPLVDTLLYDSSEAVRLAAASALAPLAADPTARAALENAASFDASPNVRLQAAWASLDDDGRRAYVASALLDVRRSDADRLAPLVFAAHSAPVPGLAIDGRAATALVEILRRSDDPDLRASLMRHLYRSDAPEVNAFLLERLARDASETVRGSAAMGLAARLDAPGVRDALEQARTADSSPLVRELATVALADRSAAQTLEVKLELAPVSREAR